MPSLYACVSQDEPSTGMDPTTRRHLWDALTKLVKRGKSIVLTSHRLVKSLVDKPLEHVFQLVLPHLNSVWRSVRPCVPDWLSW